MYNKQNRKRLGIESASQSDVGFYLDLDNEIHLEVVIPCKFCPHLPAEDLKPTISARPCGDNGNENANSEAVCAATKNRVVQFERDAARENEGVKFQRDAARENDGLEFEMDTAATLVELSRAQDEAAREEKRGKVAKDIIIGTDKSTFFRSVRNRDKNSASKRKFPPEFIPRA